MAYRHAVPRKQRTREHIIADLSVHHVEGLILRCGHTFERFGSDYGYDLQMHTFDGFGLIEPGSVLFQVKAAEELSASGPHFVYDLDIRDYNLWVHEQVPVILILFDASRGRGYWIAVQDYFTGDVGRLPKKGARRVRIRVPKRQRLNAVAISIIRGLKETVRLYPGDSDHEAF